MTTEEGLERAWQAHLRSARYFEARDKRPPVSEADLRRQWEEAAHRAWLRWQAIARQMAHEDAVEALSTTPSPTGKGEITYRHIHQHGPALPTGSGPNKPPPRARKQAVEL